MNVYSSYAPFQKSKFRIKTLSQNGTLLQKITSSFNYNATAVKDDKNNIMGRKKWQFLVILNFFRPISDSIFYLFLLIKIPLVWR